MDWNADRTADRSVPWLDMPLNDGAVAAAAAATTGDDERRTEKGAMRLDRLHASFSSSSGLQ
jgi:hypothetical protein